MKTRYFLKLVTRELPKLKLRIFRNLTLESAKMKSPHFFLRSLKVTHRFLPNLNHSDYDLEELLEEEVFESVTNAESIDGSVRKEILKKDVLEKMNKKEKSSIKKQKLR